MRLREGGTIGENSPVWACTILCAGLSLAYIGQSLDNSHLGGKCPMCIGSEGKRDHYIKLRLSKKAARFRFSSRSLTGLSGSMLVGISIGAGVQVITVGTHVATAAALVSYAQPQMPPSTTHISMENFPNQGFVFVPQHPATHTIRKITIYLGHFFSGRWQGVLSNGHVHAEKGAAPGGRFMRGLLMVPVR
eukprot:scaffold122144_cov18-Tisochrysis_lutea.AAC.1